MKQLRALGGVPESPSTTSAGSNGGKEKKVAVKASVTDCCICLFSVTVAQALFIAPCSHVFHYKCIRPMLQLHHPGFSCPLCRTFHDLEADVEVDDAWEVASRRASLRRESAQMADVDIGNVTTATARPSQNTSSPMVVDTSGVTHDSTDDPGSTDAASEESRNSTSDAAFPETDADGSNDPGSPVTGRHQSGSGGGGGSGMSLGALPIPRLNEANPNPEYAGLDAATPMNTTFLSTLAESPLGGDGSHHPLGATLGGVVRAPARLDDVGEEETDDVRLREPADQLYT
ncbi:hypothetical protein QFC19_002593 [Naganishia cerealis]|uniref:Uncharacterized protein n=1 Tax=Naganishia cerealis TaxID=610337 RepID=A0ACC2W9P4_9TREE|nr:hypothetical protein QFC19_002593 [Naganishia cerealis]